MPTSRRCRSTRGISRFRRSIRSGPTARRSGAGSRCRPAARSTPPIRTHGFFPAGTRLWKEFSFEGQRVETRYHGAAGGRPVALCGLCVERGRAQAQLVPANGKRGAWPLGGGKSHTIPGVNDCKACHQGGRSEVLGFGLIQLSPDRDPDALDRARPARLGLPPSARAARWTAVSATERAAARLPARQLRALSQRAGSAAQSRALPAPDRR